MTRLRIFLDVGLIGHFPVGCKTPLHIHFAEDAALQLEGTLDVLGAMNTCRRGLAHSPSSLAACTGFAWREQNPHGFRL